MRYLRFRQALNEINKLCGQFDTVYFEEVCRHAGTAAAHAYGGFLGMLTAWCEELSIPYNGVPVGTIKKHATGKGNADKAAMISAAVNRGWNPKDDNQADALWLLDCVRDSQ
jgi:Holliday junction resolvasome RuvABC endonuclease subunit